MTTEERLELADFENETRILQEQLERQAVELSQFELETALIEKGVL